MVDPVAVIPAGVTRVVFKQMVEGDFRKIEAQSNDADTGGGARDLRFSPFEEFAKIFSIIFPTLRKEKRKRNGVATDVDVFVGRLHWTEGGKEVSKEVTFEPPTDARPNEGRIPVVHTYPPLNNPPATNQGKMVLLLIQRNDGTVWPAFTTEASLKSGEWEPMVAASVLRSLSAKRPVNQVARGYIDLVTGQEYSDAD
ncbi:MAG: hypothetical protein BroJett014_04440 [Planctomycetota bacterium]|nr:MAG: hypothetical protein BroJett014_04440 [Planctomycetota bacterium]